MFLAGEPKSAHGFPESASAIRGIAPASPPSTLSPPGRGKGGENGAWGCGQAQQHTCLHTSWEEVRRTCWATRRYGPQPNELICGFTHVHLGLRWKKCNIWPLMCFTLHSWLFYSIFMAQCPLWVRVAQFSTALVGWRSCVTAFPSSLTTRLWRLKRWRMLICLFIVCLLVSIIRGSRSH